MEQKWYDRFKNELHLGDKVIFGRATTENLAKGYISSLEQYRAGISTKPGGRAHVKRSYSNIIKCPDDALV